MKAATNEEQRATVFFDGACPLCRREIAWYRRLRGADEIDWIDVSRVEARNVAPGLSAADALARFHIRLPDGRLVSGGSAFAELWARLPLFAVLGRCFRTRPLTPVLEWMYRGFLRVRPRLQRLALENSTSTTGYPKWLERELRSDHAGETGAVAIYRGILAMSRNPSARDFATRHLATEARHLELMEQALPLSRRSRLLPIWRAAGFITGALPALFGPRAIFITIDAVESFVDHHYAKQIEALTGYYEWRDLRDTLENCWRDELEHRDEARQGAGSDQGLVARMWTRLVGIGSAAGVAIARRL